MKSTVLLTNVNEFNLSADDGGKWVLMCLSHGYFIQDTNKKRLAGHKKYSSQWCNECGANA